MKVNPIEMVNNIFLCAFYFIVNVVFNYNDNRYENYINLINVNVSNYG